MFFLLGHCNDVLYPRTLNGLFLSDFNCSNCLIGIFPHKPLSISVLIVMTNYSFMCLS